MTAFANESIYNKSKALIYKSDYKYQIDNTHWFNFANKLIKVLLYAYSVIGKYWQEYKLYNKVLLCGQ